MVPAVMKSLAVITFVIAVSAPAFSRTNTDDKADCEKASGVWVEKDNKCGVKKQ